MVEAQIDLHRLHAFRRHWRQQPPVHQLVAAYLKYEPPSAHQADGDLSLQQLMQSMPVNTSAPKLDDTLWQQHMTPSPEPTPHG